ncbi:hypothetical protein FRC12_006329 [Ceratobasidium sp. 428]|nr:hypothetical protein FRC12_006329 [Ceratobasidium sp. 428]
MKTRSQTSSSVPMMSQSVVETGQKQSTVSSSRKLQCRASDKEAKPVAKKRIKGKQGGLKNFVTLPVDLFAQIAGLLDPGDLVVLARTNKFFRNMLMSRSATLIWRQSFENIPDLPGCPSDMPEPQYAALVFSPYCTFCGKPVRRGVDTCLRVRICSSCLQKHSPYSALE